MSIKKLSIFLLYLILLSVTLYSQDKQLKKENQVFGSPECTHFTVSNITTWIKNNGESDMDQYGNSGLVYPKGSNKTAVFQTGLLYGGKINGEVRICGSVYKQGQVPGKILSEGTAQDPNALDVRIYRVKRHWQFDNLKDEIELREGTEQQIREQYRKDWNAWPWKDGAPYEDVNHNGIYEPDIDIPGYIGADQTIWFVCNDLDSNQSKYLLGSRPLGIEMQATIWGYGRFYPYGNCIFRKYTLINKGNNTIDSMHICIWSDPDIGDAGDDFVGCDTTLDLAFGYNGRKKDGMYGNTPPAVGYLLLQGPIVPSIGDRAYRDGKIIENYKNLKMDGMFFFIGPDPILRDPPLGIYLGTLEFWNLFRGYTPTTGEPFINPITNRRTKYCLSGDPVTGTGWIDGILHPPNDRRLGLVTGPFTMLPGDTQEVIFVQVLAGAYSNIDNIQAIQHLKENCEFIKRLWKEENFPLNTFLSIEKTEIDNKIILNWSNDSNIKYFEEVQSDIFKFQGYNIYQFPDNKYNIKNAHRIATYDVIDGVKVIFDYDWSLLTYSPDYVPTQFGMDSGIRRYFLADRDYINQKPLINGNEYLFGVSAYYSSKEQNEYFKQLETLIKPITCNPKSNDAGTRYYGNHGDVVAYEQIEGIGPGNLEIIIIDPTKLTGHTYEVKFAERTDGVYWQLYDSTLSSKLLYNSNKYNEGDASAIIDGFQIKLDTTLGMFQTRAIYRFKTTGKTYSEELVRQDLERINIYPNPYYGANPRERSQYETYVNINHLPEWHKVNIKIYDLAGQLVRRLIKNADGNQEIRWDLGNEHGLPVSSGMYIVHIEVPDYGYEKILKVGIIQEQKIPQTY